MDNEIFYRDKGSKAQFRALFLDFRQFEVLKWNTIPFETRLTWLLHWSDQTDRAMAFVAGARENVSGLPELLSLFEGVILDPDGGENGRYWCGLASAFDSQSSVDKLRILRDAIDTYFATARMLSRMYGKDAIGGEQRQYLEVQHARAADMLDAVTFRVQ